MKLLEAVAASGQHAEFGPAWLLTDWSAFLPDDYVPDEHEKLALYRRLADTRDLEQLDDLTLEMLDRFGQLPSSAIALVELRRLRLLGAEAGVESLRILGNVAEMTLRRPLKPTEIQGLVGSLNFQVEFSPTRFGVRARGEGLVLLHRARRAAQISRHSPRRRAPGLRLRARSARAGAPRSAATSPVAAGCQ